MATKQQTKTSDLPHEEFPRRTIRLGAAEDRALREEAKKKGITESEMIRRILREHYGL
jgi:hypothetical protein